MADCAERVCTWPGSRSEYSFESAVDDAISSGYPLVIDANATVEVMAPIRLPRGAVLQIRSSSPTPKSESARPTIAGCGHSIFIVGHGHLILRNIVLQHTLGADAKVGRQQQEPMHSLGNAVDADKLDKSSIGAALLGRDKARCELHGCKIVSARGFAVWLVQRAAADLAGCTLRSPARSAAVCFGQARLWARDCHFSDFAVHGVCARGATAVVLRGCVVDGGGRSGRGAPPRRAVYGYGGAALVLAGCTVRNIGRVPVGASAGASANASAGTSVGASAGANVSASADVGTGAYLAAPFASCTVPFDGLEGVEGAIEVRLDKGGEPCGGKIGASEDTNSVYFNAASRVAKLASISEMKSAISLTRPSCASLLCTHCLIHDNAGPGVRIVVVATQKEKEANEARTLAAEHMVAVDDTNTFHCNGHDGTLYAFDTAPPRATSGWRRAHQPQQGQRVHKGRRAQRGKRGKRRHEREAEQTAVWEYDADGTFRPYCPAAAEVLERSFQQGVTSSFQLPPPLQDYAVSLVDWLQTNTKTLFPRAVRRRSR